MATRKRRHNLRLKRRGIPRYIVYGIAIGVILSASALLALRRSPVSNTIGIAGVVLTLVAIIVSETDIVTNKQHYRVAFVSSSRSSFSKTLRDGLEDGLRAQVVTS